MYNSDDFVSFDDSNIDWDFILEENLSSDDEWDGEEEIFQVDENAESPLCTQDGPEKSEMNTTKSITYKCPVCSKILKSVSGFNGHVKRHGGESFKASEHKVSAEQDQVTTKAEKAKVATKSKEHTKLLAAGPSRKYTKQMLKDGFTDHMKKAFTLFHECPFQKVTNKFSDLLDTLLNNFDKEIIHHTEYTEYFSEQLWQALTMGDTALPSMRRENMWTQYATMRMDKDFQERGCLFIEQLSKEPSLPKLTIKQTFNSFLRRLFEIIIKVRDDFDREDVPVSEENTKLLPNEEQALHYIGGYIFKSLHNKFKIRKQPKFQAYLNCINDFVSVHDTEPEMSFLKSTHEWTRESDRGGLKYITDDFFLLLRHIEMCTRKYFTLESVKRIMHLDIRKKVMDNLSVNPMLPYYWDKLSISLHSTGYKEELLSMIVKLYLTIRGNSFAKKLHDAYEMEKNITLKSQKGLRKSLKLTE